MVHRTKFKQTEVGIIPNDWKVKRIGDLVKINNKTIGREFEYSEIEYIDIDSVENGRIKNIQKINLKEAPSRAKRIISNGDIIISTVRPNLKHFAFIKQAKPNSIVSTGFAVISCDKINPKFLYYFLRTDKYTEYLTAIADAHTSTYPSFNPDIIENSFCPFPSEAEQINIAKILSDLDLKIELNQKMNRVLEEIGQTLFKRWFIDFEFPDEKGKPYMSNGGEMVDSELGKIPRGWRVGKVIEIAEQLKEQISPNENKEKMFFHYSIEAFDSGLKPVEQLGSEILSNKFVVRENTILMSKLNPRIQRIWPVINAREYSICSTEFLVFRPRRDLLSYLYYSLLLGSVKRRMASMARGTSSSHQRVSAEDILRLPLIIPSIEILELFEVIVFPSLLKREQNVFLEIKFNEIRDSLLPRLMSGKIRIPLEAKV